MEIRQHPTSSCTCSLTGQLLPSVSAVQVATITFYSVLLLDLQTFCLVLAVPPGSTNSLFSFISAAGSENSLFSIYFQPSIIPVSGNISNDNDQPWATLDNGEHVTVTENKYIFMTYHFS